METLSATRIFESLASGLRLEVYRLLVRAGRTGLVAGEIATAMDLPPGNLSFHLKALAHAKLIQSTSEGRYLRYRANLPLMLELIGYLSAECCAGEAEDCAIPDQRRVCAVVADPRP